MTRMKSTGTIRTNAAMVLLLLFLGLPAWGLAAEDGYLDAIKSTLASSALSKAEQAEVHAKAAVAINAGVPADDVEIIVSRAVRRGANAGVIRRFLETGTSTRQQGLPVGPVLDRIEQGLSKGVPPERIAAAAQRLSEKLKVAQPLVDGLVRGGVKPGRKNEREAAIEATARALEASIPAEDLKGMGVAVRDRKGSLLLFTSAANTAAYFVGNGMSAKTSSHLVQNALEKGYSERDLDGMVKQMADRIMRGTMAEDAARQMEQEGMQGGMGGSGGMGGMGGMGGRRR